MRHHVIDDVSFPLPVGASPAPSLRTMPATAFRTVRLEMCTPGAAICIAFGKLPVPSTKTASGSTPSDGQLDVLRVRADVDRVVDAGIDEHRVPATVSGSDGGLDGIVAGALAVVARMVDGVSIVVDVEGLGGGRPEQTDPEIPIALIGARASPVVYAEETPSGSDWGEMKPEEKSGASKPCASAAAWVGISSRSAEPSELTSAPAA